MAGAAAGRGVPGGRGALSPPLERPRAADVAIVIDGNRRWASARGLSPSAGHEAGADTLGERVRDALELGIEQLTVYSLSTENLARPAVELVPLIELLAERIERETPRLSGEGVSVQFIGNRDGLPPALVEEMCRAEQLTARNRAMTLFLAVNYGSRAEIVHAASRFRGGDEHAFGQLLYAPAMRDPGVVIRTGGERRLSNFLLWQAAYSELVFREELWPDFSREALERSLDELDSRVRRFGGR